MTGKILRISFLALMAMSPFTVQAQDKNTTKPIFINPYSPTVPTYATDIPNMVRAKNGSTTYNQASRTYTKPNRISSGPTYDPVFNPFPADYGRMRTEKDFYDIPTGRYYEQYDYFKLLSDRGDTAGLAAAVKEVQEGGVFDPAKYQAVMNGTGLTDDGSPITTPVKTQQVYQASKDKTPVTKNLTQGDIPQKLHSGYDEDATTVPTPAPARQKNQPIFLR